ncbi:perlucin-like isoform X2 [Ruditapes philippinarum]|uniref:perlucin-like isoform X2 n=1 Tax=Ruditapes philippinarum TaxID=129788 RepID=UPI00295A7545|nr:perlucin-like isoform X2 [Ruditapes philippinarum]
MSGMLRLVFALYLVCCVATQQNFNCYYEEKFLAKVYRLEYRVEMLEEKASKEDYKECMQCPDGWIQYKGSCYMIVEEKLSFDKARANCQKFNADLVHIDNADENTFIRNHLRTLKGIDFWIGLTDAATEGLFKWVDDNSRATFTDWYPSQPDNGGNREDCVHFKAIGNIQWNDRECYSTEKSICEKKIMF